MAAPTPPRVAALNAFDRTASACHLDNAATFPRTPSHPLTCGVLFPHGEWQGGHYPRQEPLRIHYKGPTRPVVACLSSRTSAYCTTSPIELATTGSPRTAPL